MSACFRLPSRSVFLYLFKNFRNSEECLKLFFLREETGEMDLKRIDQIGRKYLSSALVSEKGIFQSATPQCCGKIILGSPETIGQGRAELLLLSP